MNVLAKIFITVILNFLINLYNIKSKIIPDEQNPFLVKYPTISMKGQKMLFNFKLTSKLFNYNYIAVVFPVNLNFNTKANFSCSLFNPKSRQSIVLLAIKSGVDEGNTAFCQINDASFPLVESTITYQFALTFEDINLSANYSNKISLFTASDINKAQRIIFDSNYFYSQLAAFNDFTKIINPALSISDIKSSVTSLVLFTNFDLTVTFTVQTFISKKSLILFKFPSIYVSEPYYCFSEKAAENDNMKLALQGNILCKLLADSKDTLVLTGLEEDLPQTRSFKITFRGFNTLSLKNSDKSDVNLFEAIVLYSNSYSVLSYSAKAIFIIDYVKISQFQIANNENQEIFKGAAWPIKITFTIDTDISTPAYITLQQQDQSDNAKISFLASTCDFSQNPGFVSSNFGDRPKCFPLSLDKYNYSKKGNGFVFRVNSLQAKKMYTIVLFAFPEACGNYNYTTSSGNNISSVTFSFILTIYSDIKSTEVNEKRIFFDTNKIYAITAKTDMSNPCFNSLNMRKEITNKDPDTIYDVSGSSTSVLEKLLYNEIHDYKFGMYTNTCDSDSECYFYDLRAAKPFNEGYIYSKNKKKLLNNSYFALRSSIPYTKISLPAKNNKPFSRHMIAINVIRPNIATENPNAFGSSSMHYIFNKNFFQKGDSLCSLWWGYRHEFIDTTKRPYTVTELPTGIADPKQYIMSRLDGMDPSFKNFLTESGSSPNIDTTFDRFNEPSIRIVSKTYLEETKVFLNTAENACKNDSASELCNILNFSIFTNCIKWKAEIPEPLWQYAYFDLTLKFRNQQSLIFSRVNRFFKFVTNAYATDPTIYSSPDESLSILKTFNPAKIKYYFSVFEGISYDNAICIISIDKDELINIATDDSNMLKINFFGLTLFDADYSKVSATYPVSSGNNQDYFTALSYNSQEYLFGNSLADKKANNEIFVSSSSFYSLNLYADSHYPFLGPLIVLNNFRKANLKSNLIIPLFCPSSSDFGIAISWQTSYLNTNTGYVDRYNSIAYFVESCTGSCDRYKSFYANTSSKSNETVFNKGSIYFKPYSMNNTVDKDNLFLYIRNTYANNISCNAISWLINSSLETLDQNNLSSQTDIRFYKTANNIILNTVLVKTNYLFHAFGKSFNKAIFSISSDPIEFTAWGGSSLDKDNLGSDYLYGIYRPTVDYFTGSDASGFLSINDRIAFSCVTDTTTAFHLSNIKLNYESAKLPSNSIPSSTSLILDFVMDSKTAWPKFACDFDRNYPNYKDDKGGSIICSVQTPIKIFTNSKIQVELAGLNLNTVCSMKSKNNPNAFNNSYCTYVIVGTDTISQVIACPVNYADDSFDIACYNVRISFYKITVTGLQSYFTDSNETKYFKNPNIATLFITDIVDNFTVSKTPALQAPTSLISFQEISYAYAAQQNAIGKIYFNIKFPRKILRNSMLSILIDLSGFIIKSMLRLPECRVIMSALNNYQAQENVLRSCELIEKAPEDNTKSKIILKFFSENYLQNFDLSDNIAITLFPVFTPFINSASPFFYKFTYQYINSTDIISTADSSQSKILSTASEIYFTDFAASLQDSGLCDITNVFPGIINEYNKITIFLDLQTNYYKSIKDNYANYPLNEILFFLPSKYVELSGSFECWPKSSILTSKSLKCELIADEELPSFVILRVMFSNEAYFPPGYFEIFLTGVKINTPINNRGYNATNIYTLPSDPQSNFDHVCAFNNYSLQTKKRITLINGFGALRYNFILPLTYGTLNIDSVTSTNYLPRKLSMLSLKINFELLNSLTLKPAILDGFPFFVVVFPKELILKYSKALGLTCSLYDLTGSDSQQALTPVFIPTKPCELIANNMVYIQINNSTKNVSAANFRSFQLNFNGTYNTADEVDSTGVFEVYLSSDNKNYIYKTYRNLNYLANQKLSNIAKDNSYNYIDSIIAYYRGMTFSYDTNSWIIDAYNIENDIIRDSKNIFLRNKISIKIGRFTQIILRVRDNKNIPNASTGFSLPDIIFSFYDNSKQFLTSLNSLEVYIGASCTSIPGTYYSAIYYTNTASFYPLTPLDVKLEYSIATVNLGIPLSPIIKGSIYKIPVSLSEPNFDQLQINFYPDTSNDPASKISQIELKSFSSTGETSFQSSFTASENPQYFTTKVLNNCFAVPQQYQTFFIKITQNNSVLDTSFKLEDSFILSDPVTNIDFARNSLKIIFSPPVSYGYISCIAVCFNSIFPTDSVLMNDNFQEITNQSNSNNSAFTKTFSNSNQESQTVSFDNLIRGERYKLKCVFQFTSVANTITRFSEIEKLKLSSLTNINDINNISNQLANSSYLETPKNTPTQCIQFFFSDKPDSLAQSAMIYFCQTLFNNSAGCPVCIDSYGNIHESVYLSSRRTCGVSGNVNYNLKSLNLDIVKKQPYTQSLYFSREYVAKYLSQKALSQKTVKINNKVIPLFTPYASGYLLCVVQDKLCSNNMNSKAFADLMNKLHFSLNGQDKINKNLGIPDIGYLNSVIITDEKPIIADIVNYIIALPGLDSVNNISMQIYYKIPLLCHWKIQLSSVTAPESYQIEKCYDEKYCGSIKINMIPLNLFLISKANIEDNKVYNIYLFCYNDIPYPTNSSDVILLSQIKNLAQTYKFNDGNITSNSTGTNSTASGSANSTKTY